MSKSSSQTNPGAVCYLSYPEGADKKPVVVLGSERVRLPLLGSAVLQFCVGCPWETSGVATMYMVTVREGRAAEWNPVTFHGEGVDWCDGMYGLMDDISSWLRDKVGSCATSEELEELEGVVYSECQFMMGQAACRGFSVSGVAAAAVALSSVS